VKIVGFDPTGVKMILELETSSLGLKVIEFFEMFMKISRVMNGGVN
jgi:hypothetical protein